MTIENKYIIAASGDHLGKHLPDNFQNMSETELHEFIADNKLERNEHDDEACSFQRHWRELIHLSPMIGEFLIEA